ncbi:polyphosphate glucokinase [Allocatelliglobosispora scoriae]|uniref:Polyphosphate glucokinase n=1 Tax=Allocatelliglobosispora scoriae TaxID=643052 RepID=A0A841BKN1_9ACTN|nr:ROK family protein [Allocatelliglobosispora scoriae]MBB5867421.1 polyphosphate glucokinase [Allocatelliglobosispora scoriae]
MTATEALGVDIGGSGIKGAPVDLVRGALIRERVRIPTPSPATPEAVAATLTQLLAEIGTDGPVGVTLPAVVTHGVARTAANIDKSWMGTDAAALFTAATGRRVSVVNDADAAGLAEVRYGAGAGRDGVVIVVTLGTGIGSAVFTDGVLLPNTELGHLHLHHGDAEAWAADSARERDDLSWEEYAERLEQYFRLLHGLFWPDLIIVGGGISKKSEKYLPLINVDTEVVPAVLQNSAGIVGAAMHAPQ